MKFRRIDSLDIEFLTKGIEPFDPPWLSELEDIMCLVQCHLRHVRFKGISG